MKIHFFACKSSEQSRHQATRKEGRRLIIVDGLFNRPPRFVWVDMVYAYLDTCCSYFLTILAGVDLHLGMNPNCLYAEPGDWNRVAAVQGEAANHYTNDAGYVLIYSLCHPNGSPDNGQGIKISSFSS